MFNWKTPAIMQNDESISRRTFLGVTVSAPAGLALPALCSLANCVAANDDREPVGPPEPPTSALRPNPNSFPVETRSQVELWEEYGDPEDDSNLEKVRLPFPMEISFLPGQNRHHLWAHKKVSDSLSRVLERVHETYGNQEIERLGLNIFGGDHEDRKMTGAERWSLHSWAIAFDFDPKNNRYRWSHERARFAHPDYRDWWAFWLDEGWFSLGVERDFDWMHVQAATRRY